MAQFWEFFSFELKFRLKSISTYVYFLLWFTLAFLDIAADDFGFAGNGKQLLNGPYTTSLQDFFCCLFGVLIIAAIFGVSVLRDFQRDTYQLMFTKPISKFAYLGGRWLGSFVATVFAFSGIVFGEIAGTLAPWADHTRIVTGHPGWYWQPFFSIVVVQIFFFGSLFFLVAALSRKIVIVYLQGVAVLMLYFVINAVFATTRSLEHFWSAILDPIGLQLMSAVTRYWTVAEKNSLLFSWSPHVAGGVFLINRLIWLGAGLLCLAITYRFFPMSVEALTARSQGRRAARAKQQDATDHRPVRSFVPSLMPKVTQDFGSGFKLRQLTSLTRLRISNTTHEVLFWALAILIFFFALIFGHFAGRAGDTNVFPVTFLMLGAVEGNTILLMYVVVTIYAGELIWRERDTRFAGINDALPTSETIDWLSKFFALLFVEVVLLALIALGGIIMQTVNGYFHYELLEYFQELYLLIFPSLVAFTLLAFFVQTIVSNKFIGHAIVLGMFVMQQVLFRLGVENSLLNPGYTPPYTYSDMNGYGYFVPSQLWGNIYWLAVFAVLAVISISFARRGAEDAWSARFRLARRRLPALQPAAIICLLVAIGSGGWYYYNAHVLNEFLTTKQRREIQAQYERDFKQYEHFPQPKVIAVEANIDLDPAHRRLPAPAPTPCKTRPPLPSSRFTSRIKNNPSQTLSSTAPSPN